MDTTPTPNPSTSIPPAQAQPQPQPDIMNDAIYAPQAIGSKPQEEQDTCRICRGESTTEEPLFHPCKCSGSIKFVHQECLMEWLSHSQKKHCELCKTPFRFTKLYHPHMPQTVPTLVFLKRAFMHIVGALLNWCRGMLVISVWSVWLPWSMRFVWSGLFWLGDGGWLTELQSLKQGQDAVDPIRTISQSDRTQRPSPPPTTHPTLPLMMQLPLLRDFLGLLGFHKTTNIPASSHTSNSTILDASIGHRGSLLSGLEFFQDLTPHAGFNKFVLDTSEGQVITLAVVTGFILVFLIREWVVQQQPALNLGFHNEAMQEEPPRPPELAEPDPERAPTDLPDHDDSTSNDAAPRHGSLTAAALSSVDNLDDSVDVSTEAIAQLIDDLKQHAPALNYLAHHDFAEWQGDQAALLAAEKTVAQTRLFYLKLKTLSKKALDDGSTKDAKQSLDRLSQLQEALTYLPWANEREMAEIVKSLQGFMNTAYELLTLQEGLARETSDDTLRAIAARTAADADQDSSQLEGPTADASAVDVEDASHEYFGRSSTESERGSAHPSDMASDDAATEPLLDIFQLDEDSNASQKPGDDAVRPAMPDRIVSSVATSIQRQLEEEGQQDAAAMPQTVERQTDSPVNGNESWSFVDVPKSNEDEVASNFQNSNQDVNNTRQRETADIDSGETSELSRAPSGTPSRRDLSHRVTAGDPIEVDDSSATPRTESTLAITDSELGSTFQRQDNQSSGPTASANAGDIGQRGNVDDSATGLATFSVITNPPVADRSYWDQVLDWIFGDLVPAGPPPEAQDNEVHVVQDIAAEAPFIPFRENQPHLHPADDAVAAEQVEEPQLAALAAAQAANIAQDAEAVEEAEDLEGILELIGMQGPLAGLFQNAVFAAVLVSATIATAILFPYICGKMAFLLAANPVSAMNVPLQSITFLMNLTVDSTIVVAATTMACIDTILLALLRPFTNFVPGLSRAFTVKDFRHIADSALLRIIRNIPILDPTPGQSQPPLDTLVALRSLQASARYQYGSCKTFAAGLYGLFANLPSASTQEVVGHCSFATRFLLAYLKDDLKQLLAFAIALPKVIRSGELVFQGHGGPTKDLFRSPSDDWTMADRSVAVLAGYISFALAGALYVRRGAPFSTSEQGRKIEHIIRESFLQSAGVIKVILIIGIEMLVFPFYCGCLLDTAMLPLFGATSLSARLSFTHFSVYTSIFFHWFVGTCYMFHFALYVAMCRKIFRKGVLYFIRDPDDPNFHPVRDVLERSVSSQLKKIGFSALVYGGLVIFCMGSVVWAVAYGVPGIFPLTLTAKDSYFGYPVDLLLYNLLAPLALHFLRPSNGLQQVYDWWFRRSAGLLRLSHFLFHDMHDDDGDVLGTDGDRQQHGSYVRAPATDHLRLPRGRPVFLEVDENNNRLDHQPEPEDTEAAHGLRNEQYVKVWIPPYFKLRVVLFVILMWMLTAIVGLSSTVLPLVLGRQIMSSSTDIPTNDLYAYFAGVTPLLAIFYSRTAVVKTWVYLRETVRMDPARYRAAATLVKDTALRATRVLYTYGTLALLLPSLIACALECYFILPLQTYNNLPERPTAPHTVYLLQDWTLGLLYLRIAVRVVLWDRETRIARALRAIVARGWFDPDACVATRCLILPITILSMVAICVPSGMAWLAGRALPHLHKNHMLADRFTQLDAGAIATMQTDLIRFSYPMVLAIALSAWSMWMVKHAASRWRMRIRDEIYLIGERLHNFGEGR